MVQTDSVEGIEKGERALDLMGLDHSFQNISHCEGLA